MSGGLRIPTHHIILFAMVEKMASAIQHRISVLDEVEKDGHFDSICGRVPPSNVTRYVKIMQMKIADVTANNLSRASDTVVSVKVRECDTMF